MPCTNRQLSNKDFPFTTPFPCVLCVYNNTTFSFMQAFSYIYFQKTCNQKKKGSKQGANFTYSILKFFFLSQIQEKHVYALFEQTLFLLGNAQKIQGFH